jgi:hypothetical protein
VRRILVVVLIAGVVVLAYSCGAGRGTLDEAIVSAGGWSAAVALCVGAGLGAAYARAKRSRQDWVDTKGRMRELRTSTFGAVWLVAKWGTAALVIAALAVAAAGRN